MTKWQAAQLLNGGVFGNTTRTWLTFPEWDKEKNKPQVGCRSKIASDPGFCANLGYYAISANIFERFYLQECVPHDDLLVQGEVMESPSKTGRYDMRVSLRKISLRDAMRSPVVDIERSTPYLKIMDADSRYNMLRLFKWFPGHVVEFSVFREPVGKLGWNTIFWEVRNY